MAEQSGKIPVIIGVTGHDDIIEEDKPALKAKVIESIRDIQNLCKGKKGCEDTPVIMLNSLSTGAGLLCAEAAFELGIEVYAVLPCEKEKYAERFTERADRDKFEEYISKAKRQFVAPDIERNKAWIKKTTSIDDDNYENRQLGIYMAEHSHVLIALWDGNPPEKEYDCGVVEVIQFAVEHKFLDKDKLFKPGMISDSAVIWIKARRKKEAEADMTRKWLLGKRLGESGDGHENDYILLDKPPEALLKIISKTVEYNGEKFSVPKDAVKLWKDVDELDEYRKNLRINYMKADNLSCNRNQKKYNSFMLAIAIIGTLVAFTFLIYDDASLPYMIIPCTAAIGAIITLIVSGRRNGYHKKYIDYRALAEAFRIQFYLSMCLAEKPAVTNVCDLYSWSQRVNMIWIDKAIQALDVISEQRKIKVDASTVIDVWIGNHEKPTGQLKYHLDKISKNRGKAKKYERFSKVAQILTILIYFVIFVFEIVAFCLKACHIEWFWEGNAIAHVTWRNLAAIVLGTVTAGSLLASSFWGKLSYDRKADDNEKMSKFYASAFERWNEVKKHVTEIERFVKEIAREEIVENGIWCSYVNEDSLEINI